MGVIRSQPGNRAICRSVDLSVRNQLVSLSRFNRRGRYGPLAAFLSANGREQVFGPKRIRSIGLQFFPMARIVLAMSGGVDSSVAAHLLVQQGHEVIGVFMRHGEGAAQACSLDGTVASSPVLPILQNRADHKQGCCSASDANDARMVADRLGIPFYALNLEEEFGRIIDYFVDQYTQGRTPNPCVMCNNWIKFGKLFDYADSVDAQYVATGHYARLVPDAEHPDGAPALIRGRDDGKDQSYVLFGIQRQYLQRPPTPRNP